MAETATPAPAPAAPTASEQIASLEKSFATLTETVEKIAKQPVYPNGMNPGSLFGGQAPFGTTGKLGEQPYSIMKAAAFSTGAGSRDECKEELQISDKLRKHYGGYKGFTQDRMGSILVVAGTDYICDDNDEIAGLKREIKQKQLAAVAGFDPEEAKWLVKKFPHLNKALGTISDTAGGSLVGFPQLGELIELQRNREVFANAGSTEIALPANGRISFPKQTGGATAYWVGEAASITTSQQTTGSLLLEAKKLGILVPVNNELFRFANPTAEGMIRMDMARVAALKADLSMLEGTGGTQIKGLITYSDINSATASVTSATGDTFQPEDVQLMEAKLPDAIEAPTAYVMRRLMYAYIKNRRVDSVAAGDAKGPFAFDITRTAEEGPYAMLNGARVVRSNQVSATRSKGGVSTLSYILCGAFYEWITARFGVMEMLVNPYSDTGMTADQTYLRGIQHLDAGPRHAASFVLCDTLRIA